MTDPTCQRCGKSLWLHAELDYTGETDIAVCEGFMKEKENKIKTPVRFGLSLLQDADGENLCIMRQASYGSYDLNEVAHQICDALNATAREARLVEALEHFDGICSTCLSAQDAHDENGEVDMIDEIGRMVCGTPYYPATDALAEHRGEQ